LENFYQTRKQACIFKVGDDVRQDMLCLQMIEVFQRIWKENDLNLYLFPYKVVATARECGIIEVVPNAKSRDQLGKTTDNGLLEWFISQYGNKETVEFQKARRNFIESMAAYSIVCYILWIKDRHNGNILVDVDGHVIHIDFGFIFDWTPGRNMGFESAPFKLSEEMVEVMGGLNSEYFRWYVELCIKGYLACRPHMESIISLAALMMDTGLSCFKDETPKNMRNRFSPEKSDREAAEHVKVLIRTSFSNFRTKIYDILQSAANNIDWNI